MTSLSMWVRGLRDVLSPRYCPVCGGKLNAEETLLCPACLMRLPYFEADSFYDNSVSRLFWGKIPVEKAYSFICYRHDSDSHRLLMHLKYIHRPDIGREMGRIIAHELSKRGFFREIDALVPVPLHWIRHWKRGYNQSLQLALGIHKVTRIPVWEHVVRRTRNNATQTSKSYTERMQNVENLFAARPLGKPCHLLLIDDVLTTGATLTSCAQSILAANPDVRFSILTLAKA